MRYLHRGGVGLQVIVDPPGKNCGFHRRGPRLRQGFHPTVQVQACGGERAFGVDHATAVLHAVADRPLVNIQSDVIHRLPGKKAISYCGLCGAEKSSGHTTQRTPLSKQRNKHLQTTLIEAAKMAPRYSPSLALLYDREKRKGNANRATLAVARKLVAYLMAIDRGQRNFQVMETSNCIAA